MSMELSEKPLILLFWVGTLLVFAGGLVAIGQRERPDLSRGLREVPSEKSGKRDVLAAPGDPV